MKGWRPFWGSSYVVFKPRCTHTQQCLHFIDDLDECSSFSVEELELVLAQVDPGEALHRVVAHLSACSICVAELLRARQERQQQRHLLMTVLANSETQVPSTSTEIIAALWKEKEEAFSPSALPEDQVSQKNALFVLPFHPTLPSGHRKSNSPAFRLVSVVSLVSATVLVLWSSFSMLNGAHDYTRSFAAVASLSTHTHSVSTTPTPAFSLSPSHSWSSILFTHVASDGKSQVVEDYDMANGKDMPLALTACCAGTVVFDSLAHSGDNYVFHVFVADRNSTIYYMRTGQQFSLQGKGSNVVWSTDDQFVFVIDGQSVLWKINVQSGQANRIAVMPVFVAKILFARDVWLYFQVGEMLYRLDTASTSPLPQLVLDDPSAVLFGLDPHSATLYFSKETDTGQTGIYAQDTTTNEARLLYAGGMLVGYDQGADDSLMIVQQRSNDQSFQLVEYDPATTAAVTVSAIAPGAQSLCDGDVPQDSQPICADSIAYSPFERQLVVEAGYADGSHKVWSIDWQDKTTTPLTIQTSNAARNVHLQFIGWDTLQVG